VAGRIKSIENMNSPHQVSNPRPFGLLHSALTTTLPRTPLLLLLLLLLLIVAPVEKNRDYGRRGSSRADYVTLLYQQKLELNSPTSGGRSVGVVCSRTHATELLYYVDETRSLKVKGYRG
jgi:hypothetical protein